MIFYPVKTLPIDWGFLDMHGVHTIEVKQFPTLPQLYFSATKNPGCSFESPFV